MTYTNAEKAAEAEREMRMRHDVYRRKRNGMTPLDQRRINIMEEISEDYKRLAESERLV
jgi:hypothetical protein